MTFWPMAITIGKDEAALLLATATASVGVMTMFGRWSGRRAERIRAEKEAAIAEQKERDRLEAVEQDLKEHLAETAPLIGEFNDYKILVQTTAQSVSQLSARVGELVRSNENVLETMHRFLTGELTWKPGLPKKEQA